MLKTTAFGRIASNIDVKKGKKKNKLYTSFLLASHENKETTFIRCIAFDGTATLLSEYFTRGDRILVYGDLINDDYKGSKYVFKIKVDSFSFVETKKEHEKNKEKHKSNGGKKK